MIKKIWRCGSSFSLYWWGSYAQSSETSRRRCPDTITFLVRILKFSLGRMKNHPLPISSSITKNMKGLFSPLHWKCEAEYKAYYTVGITAYLRLEGTSGDRQAQRLCPKQGELQHVVQDCVRSGFVHVQRWGSLLQRSLTLTVEEFYV